MSDPVPPPMEPGRAASRARRAGGPLAAAIVLLACAGGADAQGVPPRGTPFGGPFGGIERGPGPRPELPEFGPDRPGFALPPVAPGPDRGPEGRPPLSESPRVRVLAFRFEGNTAIPDADLAAVAAPFAGREVTAEDLQELRYRLTQLHVDRGYITSGAVLPDQDVTDGVVTYRIVEGELADIVVTGTGGLDPAYVSDRLRLGAGKPLHLGELRGRIQLLLQDPLFERLNAELVPGARRGESLLSVLVTRARPQGLWLGLDNAAPPSTGEPRGTALGVLRNLTGWGDSLEIGYDQTEGARDLSLDFQLPVNRYGTRLTAGLDLARARVVEEPIEELDIRSRSRSFEAGIVHPLVLDAEDRVEIGASIARRSSLTSLLGRPFSFSEGVQDGRSTITALRLSQTWLRRRPDEVLAARSTFSRGLGLGAVTENPDGLPDGDFLSWLGQFQWARRFDERGTQLLVRADLQLARDPLLPLEQVAIGGVGSVRGHRENTLVRDQGLIASVEGRVPLLRLPVPWVSTGVADGWLAAVPSFDYGLGWNRGRETPEPRSISSLGLGLRWDLSPEIQAQVTYAHPLREPREGRGDALQDRGIHFRLSARVY